jgi:arylsulfatase A-like enzyme
MRSIILLGIGLMVFGVFAASAGAASTSKPNILFIVADDMGYGDCGVQGCRDIPTPNLDALANGGVRFTDGYVTGPVCSPTRAALMTGRYQARDGVKDWIPHGKPGLNVGVPTVADYLRKAGYRTALIGKWHLGEEDECHPLNRGFDEFYGFLGGGRNYFQGQGELAPANHNNYTRLVRGREPVRELEYTTYAFAREAMSFIGRQKANKQPFFLFLSFNAVHTPLQAPPDVVARFPAIKNKTRQTYAAMVSAMDESIGRVLKALREAGLEENTLVCFISDNGGPITRNAPNGSTNTPLRGGKGEIWEGGIRVPFFMSWKGRLAPGTTYGQPVSQMDLTATALALAGVTPEAKWPVDGVDLLPFLDGKRGEPHSILCWEYERRAAIRQGQWKLVFSPEAKGRKQAISGLYDLASDIGENQDLAGRQPERVESLQSLWSDWRKGVEPSPSGINR